jgi:hypothetical protein
LLKAAVRLSAWTATVPEEEPLVALQAAPSLMARKTGVVQVQLIGEALVAPKKEGLRALLFAEEPQISKTTA